MEADLTRDQELIVLDGSTFVLSGPDGEIGRHAAHGYFRDDVRHLSRWELLVDGAPLVGITGRRVEYYSARTVLAPSAEGAEVCVRRDRFVTEGVHEDIVVSNLSGRARRLELTLRFGADFADVMDVRGDGGDPTPGAIAVTRSACAVTLACAAVGRGTRIAFGADGRLEDDRATFALVLPPHGEWRTCVDIAAVEDGEEAGPLVRCDGFAATEPELPISLREWCSSAPRLRSDDERLRRSYRRSLHDLASLRMRPRRRLDHAMPAGGMPWFMCVFGRDAVIASYEALPYEPTLAEATLQALAGLQATGFDDWRDAEPGKMPHELRRGNLVKLGRSPRDPYYGTHDATPLWLILLDEYERWTGDAALVRRLEPAARRAVTWMDEHGDLDGDGYLEYERRSSAGLRNQCWKDSDDSMLFADGRRADPPIACCEFQGYAYDARLRVARLARELWDDEELARREERSAARLKRAFNRDFWNDERGTFLLALAGRSPKQRVDAVTSNAGQLLWSGIVDDELAPRLVDRLLSAELFTGWGIRTMSSRDAGFNPLSYHNGSVWPHDNALIAAGLRRYGFDAEACAVLDGLLDAAAAFGHRLPELFAGFARDRAGVPVRYPAALVPQAWAAGAPLLAQRTLLGLEVIDGKLRCDPLTTELGLCDLRWRGERLDVP